MRAVWIFAVALLSLLNSGISRAGEVAVVNGIVITDDALKARMADFPEQVQDRFSSPEGRRDLLDAMITQEVLLQESKRLGLEKDKDVLAKIEEGRTNILVNALIEKLIADKVNPKTMEAYYGKHSDEFREVRASHILVKTEADAKDIAKQLKKGGDFAELAKKLSQDKGSAENGGDVGSFTKETMVKPFADKAFSMKVGEISGPVKSQFGWHIIKVTEIRPLKKFADLSDEDKRSVKRTMLAAEMEMLKGQAKITINDEAIAKIK